MDCPNCGGTDLWRDSADVGVGIIYGPYGCPCGWSESEEYNQLAGSKLTASGSPTDPWGGAHPSGVVTTPKRPSTVATSAPVTHVITTTVMERHRTIMGAEIGEERSAWECSCGRSGSAPAESVDLASDRHVDYDAGDRRTDRRQVES